MPLVAIAGGTSNSLGRSITHAIISAYPDGKWKPIILSRSEILPSWTIKVPRSSYEIRKVDYSSTSSLDSALRGCHTVISVILAKDGTQASCQIALLEASVRSGCKRFVPSEWACGPAGIPKVSVLNMAKPPVWEACDKSGLEWARFNVGLFMNYLGIGCTSSLEKEEEACAGVDREGDMADGSGSFLVSMSSVTAEIPMRNDGDFPRITLTEINNIGDFVAASLELERWERDMNIAGSTIRLDSLLSIAERILSKRFEVTKLAKQDLETQLASLDAGDFLKAMWLELKVMYSDDEIGEGTLEPTVNLMCPAVKALDVETYLRKYWAK